MTEVLAGPDASVFDVGELEGEWYQQTLPGLALAALREHPERGGYRQLLVDEFQDIAGTRYSSTCCSHLRRPTRK